MAEAAAAAAAAASSVVKYQTRSMPRNLDRERRGGRDRSEGGREGGKKRGQLKLGDIEREREGGEREKEKGEGGRELLQLGGNEREGEMFSAQENYFLAFF